MQTVILACNTIRDELEKAAAETGCPHRFVWVESGLHLVTDSLRRRLQDELDRVSGVDRVLLAFGFCGNAVAGLKTGDYGLVIPRAHEICAALKLELLVLQGTGRYLAGLLSGPWSNDYFIVVPPFTTIDLTHLGFHSTAGSSSIRALM